MNGSVGLAYPTTQLMTKPPHGAAVALQTVVIARGWRSGKPLYDCAMRQTVAQIRAEERAKTVDEICDRIRRLQYNSDYFSAEVVEAVAADCLRAAEESREEPKTGLR